REDLPLPARRPGQASGSRAPGEESGRDRQLSPVFYRRAPARKLVQAGRPGAYLLEDDTPEQHELVGATVEESCRRAYAAYRSMLGGGTQSFRLPRKVYRLWAGQSPASRTGLQPKLGIPFRPGGR